MVSRSLSKKRCDNKAIMLRTICLVNYPLEAEQFHPDSTQFNVYPASVVNNSREVEGLAANTFSTPVMNAGRSSGFLLHTK